MNETRSRIVKIRAIATRQEGGDAQKSFWWALAGRVPDEHSQVTRAEREAQIQNQFGSCLHRYLVHQFYPTPKSHLAERVVIGVQNLSYSSFNFEINFEPFGNVVELFDGHFEYFETFLKQYVPRAFFDSLEDHYGRAISPDYSLVQFQVNSEDARGAFLKALSKPSLPRQALDKAAWLWIAANTSLVVPVLIAGLFLYYRSKGVDERQKQLDEAYKAFFIRPVKEQEAMMNMLSRATEKQEQLYDKLARTIGRTNEQGEKLAKSYEALMQGQQATDSSPVEQGRVKNDLSKDGPNKQ